MFREGFREEVVLEPSLEGWDTAKKTR